MKTRILQALLVVVVGSLFTAGCETASKAHDELVVRQPPTPTFPAGEPLLLRPPPPVPMEDFDSDIDPHVWVSDHWVHAGNAWVFIPAHRA
jgi:hypothetical protein